MAKEEAVEVMAKALETPPGDPALVELSPYGLDRGRTVCRYK